MNRYEIKIDLNLWYDKNFSIEASSQKDAERIAKLIAKESLKNFNSDIDSEWVYGDMSLDTVYVERG